MIHLVYKIPPSAQRWTRRLDEWQQKIEQRVKRVLPTTWRTRHEFDPSYVTRAPYSITTHLYSFLAQRTPTCLYDLAEPGGLRYRREDIILGHPWMDSNTIIQDAILNSQPCRLKALIFPIHHGIPQINYYARPLVERADMVFGIMGTFWYDTLEQSEFASWKPKIVRLDMALDEKAFPWVKKNFNPPGRRGYLYIGRNSQEKGCDILSKTMAGLADYARGWIGPGDEIPNLYHEATYRQLTPEYIQSLCAKYDFFVNTSVSDANPTTILEAMGWGFPVACTPQSGYYNMPSIISLSTSDIESNIKTLHELQFAPQEHLLDLSRANRKLVETHYTWERFCDTVWRKIEPYIAN